MFRYSRRTALVTGASSGIGAAFARELAARGMTTILVARSADALHSLALEIQDRHATPVHVLTTDLRSPDAPERIASEVARLGLEVSLLVNNAGVMTHGPFGTIDPSLDHDAILVNVASLVGLTHALLPGMLERREGGVINVASLAGFQPTPYLAVYAASKAFVLSFSVALREECRGRNVRVVGLCPGNTKTQLFARAGAQDAAIGSSRQPEQVVATALAALEQNRSIAIDGFKNYFCSLCPRLLPQWLVARLAGYAVQPRPKASK